MVDESRTCIACGATLSGPFEPEVPLSREQLDQEPLRAAAWSWICLGCGLVHWYAAEEDVERLLAASVEAEGLAPRAGEEYERRAQMLRMLRRVRRM